ncbi:DNA-directed RNA polymerase core subunit [Starmerella bacillaris]|uniref:DNA-directed RNA polymerases I and III subunit RPAC1 n=1 Tax=Starmerella bacillaris TaxID=1247836 RepID=A0AAV5RJE5_STABA|nr:DNA-directed RNA polymerase core subunit [Starmerella bacillaris]
MVDIHRDYVSNVSSTDFPGNFPGEDHAWDLEKFKSNFNVSISQLTERTSNFDLIGIDTSFANAFRRIMIAEVPSVAIEKVFIEQNTSVIQDEVLASRLGLVPLLVNPDSLDWMVDPLHLNEAHNVENTVAFSLQVKCERNSDGTIKNENVYAKDLKFVPFEGQTISPEPTVAYEDILIAKLRPGQEISLTCWAILGVGSDHAKFSPVATASYRLMPQISILKDIEGEDAIKFQKCFPNGVVDIVDGKPKVVDPRKDTVSREVLRHPEFEGKVKLGRRRDHFIFNIESTGAMTPAEIFLKSVAALREKATVLQSCKLE